MVKETHEEHARVGPHLNFNKSRITSTAFCNPLAIVPVEKPLKTVGTKLCLKEAYAQE